MGRCTFIVTQLALSATLLFIAPVLIGASAARPDEVHLAYLSGSEKNQPPAAEILVLPSPPDVRVFDGRWMFTGAGCGTQGSVPATIKNGIVIVRGGGGNVTPDGIIHTVGAANGLTLTAEGHLSGDSGSGTYDRSDGCSGTWIGVRQGRRR